MVGELIALAIVLLLAAVLVRKAPAPYLWEIKFDMGDHFEYAYVYADNEAKANLYTLGPQQAYEIRLVESKPGLLTRSRSIPDIYSFEYRTSQGPYYVHVIARSRESAQVEADNFAIEHPFTIRPVQVFDKVSVKTPYIGKPIVVYGGWG